MAEDTPLLPFHRNTQTSIYNIYKQSIVLQLLPSIIIGCTIWFGSTPTLELSLTAIRILAVFVGCIFALLTTSINTSVLVLTSLVILSLTQSFQCQDYVTGSSVECRLCGQLDPTTDLIYSCYPSDAFKQALAGFSSTVVWLIFAAFHLGKAVETTQLGKRMSLWMIKSFGKHIIGLAYAILFSELILAPFIPSNTARGGGIILPVVQSIASSLGSTPKNNKNIGGYLMLIGAHSNLLSASMYLTGMAPNPIVLEKANMLFPNLDFDFMTWLVGSSVPVLTCALILPFFLARSCGIFKKVTQTDPDRNEVIDHAKVKLKDMGPMSCKELQLSFVLVLCLILWSITSYTNMDSTLVALVGITALLFMNTIEWNDITRNTQAWESFFWLGGFITIATQLSEAGVSAYLGKKISYTIIRFHMPVIPTLGVTYFLTTFLFSSLSAHTVAFVSTFLEAGRNLDASPKVLTCLLAYFGALSGCMTNFSTGVLTMYFSSGYVSRNKWFLVGIQIAVLYILVYLTVGLSWWSILGWDQ